MNQLIKLGIPAWLLFSLSSCIGGCTFKTKDNAQWQLTFGSQIGVSTTSATTNASGEVSTDFPSAESWIFSKAKVAEAKAAAESDNVPANPTVGEPTPTPPR